MRKTIPAFLLSALVISLVVWYGCRGEDPHVTAPNIDPTQETVIAKIHGRVLDENNRPVADATVRSSNFTTTTDVNGVFNFNGLSISKKAGFVTVEKNGYFKGSRTFMANEGVINNVEIQLIPKATRGNFAASAGGNITIQSGSSVSFPANAIINTGSNTAYSGTVVVSGAYLDPTDPKLASIMPGNLTALSANNDLQLLRTFGMMVVQLEGSGGQPLNLASGKTATLTMPIPASMQATAPATIPLWYFDDTKGVWKEEGSATKQGTNYVGTVAHFSFWNCDQPVDFINLKLKLKNQNNQPLAGYTVSLKNTQNNSTAGGLTDSSGAVGGLVPAGVTLQMQVSNQCGGVNTQNIGPFSADTDLGTITITITAASTLTVSGIIHNCNNANVTNGFVDLLLDGHYTRASVNNGAFSVTVDRCSAGTSNLYLYAVDFTTSQQSDTMVYSVTSGTLNVGTLTACSSSVSAFINCVINGQTIGFAVPGDSLVAYYSPGQTNISGFPMTGGGRNIFFALNTPNTNTGTRTVTEFNLYRTAPPLDVTNIAGGYSANITEFEGIGGYIAGSFSGTVKDSTNTGVTYPMSCNFRVRRWQ